MLRKALLLILLAWVLAVLFAHPFFAISEPSGGKTLVVEGWMHEAGCQEAARCFVRGGYEHLYTTGTPRPFAYYLRIADSIIVFVDPPVSGELVIGAAGLPGCIPSFWVNGRNMGIGRGTDLMQETTVQVQELRQLLIVGNSNDPPPSNEPVLFIGHVSIEGTDLHLLADSIVIHRANGVVEPASPTYAHQAYQRLRGYGLRTDQMTMVPTWTVNESRTLATAKGFLEVADRSNIDAFDVATLSVHARRTRAMYRKARGSEKGIGIIALNDPQCGRWTWWMNGDGTSHVAKELIALPAPWLLE